MPLSAIAIPTSVAGGASASLTLSPVIATARELGDLRIGSLQNQAQMPAKTSELVVQLAE